jgi:hypothetical protein
MPQFIIMEHGRKGFTRYAKQMLVHKAVTSKTLLQGALVLSHGIRLYRRPSQLLNVAQLETATAIGKILQAALAELEIFR